MDLHMGHRLQDKEKVQTLSNFWKKLWLSVQLNDCFNLDLFIYLSYLGVLDLLDGMKKLCSLFALVSNGPWIWLLGQNVSFTPPSGLA